jgi:hypothetical protein
MVVAAQAFDLAATRGGGQAILPLDKLFDEIAAHPGDPACWWIYAFVFSTLIPSLTNLLVAAVSLTRGVPGLSAILARRLDMLPEGAAVPASERLWIAPILTAQWAAGAALTIGAFAMGGFLMAKELPQVGTWLLELGRAIARLDLPSRALALVT